MDLTQVMKIYGLEQYTFNKINLTGEKSIQQARQYFADCYLCSSLETLSKSTNGKRILENGIQEGLCEGQEGLLNPLKAYKCTLFSPKGEVETYTIGFPHFYKYKHTAKSNNPIIQLFEILMNEYLEKYPSQKPLISKLATKSYLGDPFEFNKPSNFLKAVTGKQPIIINEGNFKNQLKSKADEALDIFERISKLPREEHSFVTGNGFSRIGKAMPWHCYSLEKVSLKNKLIFILDKRTNQINALSFDEALEKLKFITGYFNESLK